MSSLQLALLVCGVFLVVGVVLFNRWQERRVRERAGLPAAPRAGSTTPSASRVEPTLATATSASERANLEPETPSIDPARVEHDPAWRAPMDEVTAPEGETDLAEVEAPPDPVRAELDHDIALPRRAALVQGTVAAPDPDIETIVRLQPVRPAAAGSLAAGLHARLGKPVRWYGRRDGSGPWQRLAGDSRGEYQELAGCLLLADRNGPASRAQIESFHALAGEIAASLPGAFTAPPPADEAQRGEALDRLCAELDMQIGLTVRKAPPAIIAGTRLRGVAEASGFRLAPTGRFEWVQDETGAVLFTLQNLTDEAFTQESLRTGATSGVVFLLDVPRVVDPPRAFDQMKLAAKRMTQTVGGELVDDNGRSLNDAGLNAIRDQIVAADQQLRLYNIEPGSPRALKLFAA